VLKINETLAHRHCGAGLGNELQSQPERLGGLELVLSNRRHDNLVLAYPTNMAFYRLI
jgi:hypothetical protein